MCVPADSKIEAGGDRLADIPRAETCKQARLGHCMLLALCAVVASKPLNRHLRSTAQKFWRHMTSAMLACMCSIRCCFPLRPCSRWTQPPTVGGCACMKGGLKASTMHG